MNPAQETHNLLIRASNEKTSARRNTRVFVGLDVGLVWAWMWKRPERPRTRDPRPKTPDRNPKDLVQRTTGKSRTLGQPRGSVETDLTVSWLPLCHGVAGADCFLARCPCCNSSQCLSRSIQSLLYLDSH